jgi:arginyl-tRNA synthetase
MDHLRTLFKQALAEALPGYEIVLSRPKSWDMGDVTFPCFSVAKILGQNPNVIAKNLASRLNISGADLVAVGPYLNLKLRPMVRSRVLLEAILGSIPYGSATSNGKTILVEYSSPNIAKLFTIGHLRSTMIGHSLSQVNSYLGYKVVRLNHIGDWGTQFGAMLAPTKNGQSKTIQSSRKPSPGLVKVRIGYTLHCIGYFNYMSDFMLPSRITRHYTMKPNYGFCVLSQEMKRL